VYVALAVDAATRQPLGDILSPGAKARHDPRRSCGGEGSSPYFRVAHSAPILHTVYVSP
jgi:hypothetical protein